MGGNGSRIEALLAEGFDGKAWHGPTLLSALRGVGPGEAAWSPGEGRPSIWALVLHCAYWKHVVRGRITGERRRFPKPGRNFPALPERRDAAAWRDDVALLCREHEDLVRAVRSQNLTLAEPRRGEKHTRAGQVMGIAFHDAYHAGQVRLLRKLYELRATD